MHPSHAAHNHPAAHAPFPGQGHHYAYGQQHHAAHPAVAGEHRSTKTGYDYGAHTGTNGLVVGYASPWPTPHTSGETMDKFKAWLEQPTVTSYPSVKNKHVAIVTGVAAVAGLAWYGHRHRWF